MNSTSFGKKFDITNLASLKVEHVKELINRASRPKQDEDGLDIYEYEGAR